MSLLITFLLLSIAIQFGYWIFLFQKILNHKDNPSNQQASVSIVISAKNESKNLNEYLPKILKQKGLTFEVIVANDFSTDNTDETLTAFSKAYPNLYFFTPSKDIPGKKLAITEAIDKAKYENLLLIDADCYPISSNWALKMTAQFSKRTQIILGYAPLVKKEGWLNRWARFETWHTAIQYLSYSLAEMPYMGVGRNMAYTKTRFKAVKGFSSHVDLSSGDDDLFVNQAASPYNTAICVAPDSFVYSQSPENWNKYLSQKRRHYSVSRRYKELHKWMLGIYSASQMIFYILLIICLFIKPLVAIPLYLIYISIKWRIAKNLLSVLDEKDLINWFPLLDLLLAVYLFIMAPFIGLRKKKW